MREFELTSHTTKISQMLRSSKDQLHPLDMLAVNMIFYEDRSKVYVGMTQSSTDTKKREHEVSTPYGIHALKEGDAIAFDGNTTLAKVNGF